MMRNVLFLLAFVALGVTCQPCDVLDPLSLEKYVQDLPILPRAVPNGTITFQGTTMDHYIMTMSKTTHKFHPSVGTAEVYGFNGNSPGGLFDVNKYDEILVSWRNQLGAELSEHILPVDWSLVEDDQKDLGIFAVTHLHGSHSLPEFDGLPEDYVAYNKTYKAYYDNSMNSTMIWYHDHALGITRLNAYAGLVGPYIIRDNLERSLNLPNGTYEVALILQDRALCEDGSLYYPTAASDPYEQEMNEAKPGKFHQRIRTNATDPEPYPSVIPEFFGNLIDVNGAIWPQLTVERKMYRFRILSASNARTFIIQLQDSNGNYYPITLIGGDGGLLPEPVTLKELRLMGAERGDVLIDFSKFEDGTQLFLKNLGPDEPWQADPDQIGSSNPDTTGQIMRFNVQGSTAVVSPPLNFKHVPRQPDYCKQHIAPNNLVRVNLYENYDQWGRNHLQLDNLTYMDPVTYKVPLNQVIMFEFINHSEDAHPMHIHQIEYTVCDRQDVKTGVKTGPYERESGLKDTVECPPGHITRVAVPFDLLGKYVIHCHMLEHEDYVMMRPLLIVP